MLCKTCWLCGEDWDQSQPNLWWLRVVSWLTVVSSLCDGLSRTEEAHRLAQTGRDCSWRTGPGREGKHWETTTCWYGEPGGRQAGARNKTNQHNTTHVNPSQIYYSQEQLDQEKLLPLVMCALLYYRLIYTDIVRLLLMIMTLRERGRCCLVLNLTFNNQWNSHSLTL